MPRVSVRRFLVYAAYTTVGTCLVMLALHVNQQSAWIDTPGSAQGAEDQHINIKDAEEESVQQEYDGDIQEANYEPSSTNNGSNALRRRGMPWYIKDDGYRPLPAEKIVNIWPGRFNGDRIENQLMIPYSGPSDAPIKTIFLPNGLGSWQMKGGRSVFLEKQCPVDRCSLTAKREDAATADAIMFKGKKRYGQFEHVNLVLASKLHLHVIIRNSKLVFPARGGH